MSRPDPENGLLILVFFLWQRWMPTASEEDFTTEVQQNNWALVAVAIHGGSGDFQLLVPSVPTHGWSGRCSFSEPSPSIPLIITQGCCPGTPPLPMLVPTKSLQYTYLCNSIKLAKEGEFITYPHLLGPWTIHIQLTKGKYQSKKRRCHMILTQN